jgi:hypothetical protein
MHTVVETPPYLNAARAAGISDSVRAEVVSAVAANPVMGDLIVGAGGLRKFRFSRPGEGKAADTAFSLSISVSICRFS